MTLRRDSYGVPHLWGDTVEELAYAQGHNAATDRGRQLELGRWSAEGTAAARLGPAYVAADRFARRARIADTARRCHARLDATTRSWLASYVDGVNAGLAETPVEHGDGHWAEWTPLAVFLARHLVFGTFTNKLWRAHVASTLGAAALPMFVREEPFGPGSNAWAVAGDPPVIAGDPHRTLELPGVYQQVGLACPEFDVVGLAFPGVPGVPHFGHAGSVAWAITNASADYQDLYVEDVRDGHARGADGWEPVTVHSELIEVRGADDVPTRIVETARGPLVDDGLSLRVPCRVEERLGFEALLPLLRAKTADDVLTALDHWVEPVNSVLVADTTGAVRWRVAGLVPDRDDTSRPVPAWEPRFAWRGYRPMPGGPVEGSRVNANERRAGDTADLGTDFAPPHRGERIRALLAAGTASEEVHADAWLGATVLRGLLARQPPSPPRDRILAWDGTMRADSTDAGAFAAWRAALARRLADHPAIAPLRRPTGFDPYFDQWTDPATRIGVALEAVVAGAAAGLPALAADLDALAAAALAEVAATRPRAWGETHVLDFPGVPVTPLSGDNDCVCAAGSVPGVSDRCLRGPVARYVWDLGDRAASRWVVPFGASGRPGDAHFCDQTPLWAAGRLIPVDGP
ncbi:hypothetical protein Val02_11730 [Virgisporangium aliadipatigenens]|uniref:Penicillin amidase n=1 Tax=Virgisporangium aliadipatigenens TaxID=741659 RepID=A0A8J3YHD2_9ACTN|nr:penicillin acylase family protein [Virgisporangium aliadipatigenens]GIJ44287.1 hypothetical protein Val02_11730 [Virgisporangium aliadipatigenens]